MIKTKLDVNLFCIITLILLSPSISNSEGHKIKHEHSAHSHGSGTLAIAFDDTNGKIEFKAAAFGIVGFEHAAKSNSDKKILNEIIVKFENEIQKLITFDPSLKCSYKKDKIEMISDTSEGSHSNFLANFDVNCSKSPVGTQLKVDFSSFSKIKDLDITVLVGDIQKSAEFKGKNVVIDLK